ncbi:MAG: class A beta-lactamase-related serine hydrolase [Winogradskyella sp.]|uniref:serine hydrolase domain-containing protein n=1 Tax=Winogradskyella sp. TaxID=1883156 RepID=UPI000F3C86C2|nr:serine hydrolase domain-containing protein [Winogradskyella sp.]RNC86793.1 MAG: class A beta-lactamase-related serine hydrolase [Winogradskyella sp.]
MKKLRVILILLTIIASLSCSTDEANPVDPIVDEGLYFPPINSTEWETVTAQSLGWNVSEEQSLFSFLENSGTKAFMILKDGRIVTEWYMNNFSQNSIWYWASAGKTLTAMTLGIAQNEGFLNLNDASANYLGDNWSSLTPEQENNIKVIHHLTMTTGLDYTNIFNQFCTDADCLFYLNEPGEFWYYHNAPYTLLDNIITGAVNDDFEDYFAEKIRNKIGMTGFWLQSGFNNIYRSNARSMARFGLLSLNKGVWDDEVILDDSNYFDAMVNTSQNLNESYGYLWWLNGKESYRVPGSTLNFDGMLVPNAPNDLIAGLGANDQKLYIIPSENLVILRMGDNGGEGQLGPSGYDNELWQRINAVIN